MNNRILSPCDAFPLRYSVVGKVHDPEISFSIGASQGDTTRLTIPPESAPSDLEMEILRIAFPLPQKEKTLLNQAFACGDQQQIVEIITEYLFARPNGHSRYKYANHVEYGKFLDENRKYLPLIATVIPRGHCSILSFITCCYFRAYGISALMVSDIIATPAGDAFNGASGHARVVFKMLGKTRVVDPSKEVEYDQKFSPSVLTAKTVNKLSAEFRKCRNNQERVAVAKKFFEQTQQRELTSLQERIIRGELHKMFESGLHFLKDEDKGLATSRHQIEFSPFKGARIPLPTTYDYTSLREVWARADRGRGLFSINIAHYACNGLMSREESRWLLAAMRYNKIVGSNDNFIPGTNDLPAEWTETPPAWTSNLSASFLQNSSTDIWQAILSGLKPSYLHGGKLSGQADPRSVERLFDCFLKAAVRRYRRQPQRTDTTVDNIEILDPEGLLGALEFSKRVSIKTLLTKAGGSRFVPSEVRLNSQGGALYALNLDRLDTDVRIAMILSEAEQVDWLRSVNAFNGRLSRAFSSVSYRHEFLTSTGYTLRDLRAIARYKIPPLVFNWIDRPEEITAELNSSSTYVESVDIDRVAKYVLDLLLHKISLSYALETEFDELRSVRSAPVNRIDWNATARSPSLVQRSPLRVASKKDSSALILLQRFPSKKFIPETEQIVRIAQALAVIRAAKVFAKKTGSTVLLSMTDSQIGAAEVRAQTSKSEIQLLNEVISKSDAVKEVPSILTSDERYSGIVLYANYFAEQLHAASFLAEGRFAFQPLWLQHADMFLGPLLKE